MWHTCVRLLLRWQQMCEDSSSLFLWQRASSFVLLIWLLLLLQKKKQNQTQPKKPTFFFKLLLVKPVTTTLPSSAAGCLLLRSSVSMATGVNPALPLRTLAVACVCLCAHLRSALTHSLCFRLVVPGRRQISFKVVCVSICMRVCVCIFPSLIGTV